MPPPSFTTVATVLDPEAIRPVLPSVLIPLSATCAVWTESAAGRGETSATGEPSLSALCDSS
ncbi:protein of unknown function [Burkholderia multivorans]